MEKYTNVALWLWFLYLAQCISDTLQKQTNNLLLSVVQ